MVQHIQTTTHRNDHILDVIISRATDQPLRDVVVLPRRVSDHHAITAKLHLTRIRSKQPLITARRIKAIDRAEFVEDLKVELSSLDWGTASATSAAHHYQRALISTLHQHAPSNCAHGPWSNTQSPGMMRTPTVSGKYGDGVSAGG